MEYSIVWYTVLYHTVLSLAILQNSTIKKVAEEDRVEWTGLG